MVSLDISVEQKGTTVVSPRSTWIPRQIHYLIATFHTLVSQTLKILQVKW